MSDFKNKYPIILVHGVAVKDVLWVKAFGGIEAKVKEQGFNIFTAPTDAFGMIETNAEQLKEFIQKVLKETSSDKVNLVCHSKGGLDSKYMIENLEMEDYIASMTTLSTPFKGSIMASKVWDLPLIIKGFIAFWIDLFYRILGDKHPNALKVCEQLRKVDVDMETVNFSKKIYCQSYSSTMNDTSDFLMIIPSLIHKRYDNVNNDGLVSVESSKFGVYKGDCFEVSMSHSHMIDLMATKDKKEIIYEFYINLCEELKNMGY